MLGFLRHEIEGQGKGYASKMSFSDLEYAGKRKQTLCARFLAEMEQVVLWSGLMALIEPPYPKAGGGRKPYPLDTMLRIHLL